VFNRRRKGCTRIPRHVSFTTCNKIVDRGFGVFYLVLMKTQIQLLAEQARVQSEEVYASERQQTAENTFWEAVENVIGSDALETLSERIVGLHCDTNESIDEGLRAVSIKEQSI
jgi:hypothetical protein